MKNTDGTEVLLGENTQLVKVVMKHTDLLEEIHRHATAIAPWAGLFPPNETPAAQAS